MPSAYRDKEIEIRKLLSEKLHRGKIELSIWNENSESSSSYTIDTAAVKDYHNQLVKLQEELNIKDARRLNFFGLNQSEIIPTLLKMPHVLVSRKNKTDENAWNEMEEGINKAITNVLQFRLAEGKKLEKDISLRINQLSILLSDLVPFAKARIIKIKESLSAKLAALGSQNINDNRFEQELIYYLEKQDITEEQVRLSSHLEYFIKNMKTDSPNGKKLAFIGQEIGREINTIGAKSADAEMQKIIVRMKDELEKIKEQLLNIL
tara:strand:- start:617 stop:1408 length:792 start_codon:yes stop_codon:yes gene_type:complete